MTQDNNEIDTMYIDRRNTPGTSDGNTLVGCVIKEIFFSKNIQKITVLQCCPIITFLNKIELCQKKL